MTLELADQTTWEPTIGSATHASLMEYGARVAAEDREAEILVAPYLENPITADEARDILGNGSEQLKKLLAA